MPCLREATSTNPPLAADQLSTRAINTMRSPCLYSEALGPHQFKPFNCALTYFRVLLKPYASDNRRAAESPSSLENNDYDPHLHRNLENSTTNMETLIHILKGSLGTGILAMPEAFKNAGLINGFICTILIGFICTYCLHVLVQAQYVLCKRLKVPVLTYPESMRIALETGPVCLRKFARFSPILVDVFLVLYQLGICCIYVLFVAVNLKAVVDEFTGVKIHLLIYMLILLLPFIFINCIRNLKLLAPFSILANIITCVSFGIVFYYLFMNLPDISERHGFGTLYRFPLFFGTTLFAIEAVGVIVTVENNMNTPKLFGRILNIAMVVIVFFYVGLGFLGYWRYGLDTQASITLNFPQQEIPANIVNLLYSLAIFISYGLQGYVPVQILWKTYILKTLQNNRHLLVWEYFLRTFCVVLTFTLAASIPLLGVFISLIGAFCLSALGLAFPAIIEICVKYENIGKTTLIKDILIIIFGSVGLLSGSYTTISEIIELRKVNTS